MNDKVPVLILLINYFHEMEVIDFISNQLGKQEGVTFKVVVIDNGSKDPERLDRLNDTDVIIVRPGKNLGYLGAAHFGLQQFLEENPLPTFVIVSNTDIEIPDRLFLAGITRLPDPVPEITGPAMIGLPGNYPQNPMYENRISAGKLRFLKFIFSNYIFYLVYQWLAIVKQSLSKGKEGGPGREVYALQGAMMIFHEKYFEKGGSLDYGSFLYGEEIFVAETARTKKMRTVYVPGLSVIHHAHSTTGRIKKRSHLKYFRQSYTYLLNTFYK